MRAGRRPSRAGPAHSGAIRPGDLVPVAPAIAEPTHRRDRWGEAAEKMAKENGITREAQDELALMSHQRAAAGAQDGRMAAEIAAWFSGAAMDQPVTRGQRHPRRDTTIEALAVLKPVFDRRYGSVTAGNSSPLTDGAAAVLLMAEEKAQALGYAPLAYLRSYAVAAVDPGWQLLMGPVYAVPKALERAGLAWRTSGWWRSTRRSPPRCCATCRPGARSLGRAARALRPRGRGGLGASPT